MRNNHSKGNSKKKNGKGHSIEEISLLGVEARGQIPWKKREFHEKYSKLSEIEYAYNLSLCDRYFFRDGGMKGKPNYQMIADELNRYYHYNQSIRDRYKVRTALYKYKKKL